MAKTTGSNNDAHLGFEAKLWAAADALRNNMDAAEYKHVALGLVFLRYIDAAFQQHRDSRQLALGFTYRFSKGKRDVGECLFRGLVKWYAK